MKQELNQIVKTQFLKDTTLVPQITNIVTVNNCANVCIFLKTSPIIITNGYKELDDILTISKVLYLNIGTLSSSKIFVTAATIAKDKKIKVILDPVGVGASSLRSEATFEILKTNAVSVLKGNYSEIKYIYHQKSNQMGVDSNETEKGMEEIVKQLAKKYNATVVATGPTDYISNGDTTIKIEQNSLQLTQLTGMGCVLGAVISSFVSKNLNNVFDSVVAACTYFIDCAKNCNAYTFLDFQSHFFQSLATQKTIVQVSPSKT